MIFKIVNKVRDGPKAAAVPDVFPCGLKIGSVEIGSIVTAGPPILTKEVANGPNLSGLLDGSACSDGLKYGVDDLGPCQMQNRDQNVEGSGPMHSKSTPQFQTGSNMSMSN